MARIVDVSGPEDLTLQMESLARDMTQNAFLALLDRRIERLKNTTSLPETRNSPPHAADPPAPRTK